MHDVTRRALVLLSPVLLAACGSEDPRDPTLTPLPPQLVLESTIWIDGYTEDLVPA